MPGPHISKAWPMKTLRSFQRMTRMNDLSSTSGSAEMQMRKRKKAGSPVGLLYGKIVDVAQFSAEEINQVAKAIGKNEAEIWQLPGFPYAGPEYPLSSVPVELSDQYPSFLPVLHYFLMVYIRQCFATIRLPKQREVAIEIMEIVKKCREFIEFVVEPIPHSEEYSPRGGVSDARDAAWYALRKGLIPLTQVRLYVVS